jgi:gas vesicle protein
MHYWEKAMRYQIKQDTPFTSCSQQPLFSLNHKENKLIPLEPSSQEEALSASLYSKERQQEYLNLTEELNSKRQELDQREKEREQLVKSIEQVSQDYSDYKAFSEEQLKQKNLQINQLQQIVEEQKNEIESKQAHIQQLNNKIYDLSYEIKTLLHVQDKGNPVKRETFPFSKPYSDNLYPLKSSTPSSLFVEDTHLVDGKEIGRPEDAVALLKKCIQSAQRLNGAYYHTNEESRFPLSSHHYTMDFRHLFDSLKAETGAILFIYSQKEGKPLFANAYCKTLLGVSTEKFLQDLNTAIQQMPHWKQHVDTLAPDLYSPFSLMMKTKNGQEKSLQGHLGMIPTGLFRQYIIGVLYLGIDNRSRIN